MKQIIRYGISFFILLLLQSCASSNISREANDNVTVGYQNANSSLSNMGNGSIADTFENSSQSARGAVVGGAVGAVAGSLTTGVGFVPGLATGAILGGAYGAYIDSNTTLIDQLQNRGVKVIMLGDNILLVLRSSHIFNAMTPMIRPGAYSTLDLVAAFINTQTTMSVKVSAYTNATGPARIDQALSKEQAENVVRYLWQRGVSTRLLTAAGMGGTNLVSPNNIDWEEGFNYRLEISMEKLPTSGTLG